MKAPEKKTFEKVVGIATIIGCIATIIGLFMNNILKIEATKDDTTAHNDTIVTSNLDTVFLQITTHEKKNKDNIEVTPFFPFSPHQMPPDSFNNDNYEKEFTKIKEQQAKESTGQLLDENIIRFDEAKFREYMEEKYNEYKREQKSE